MVYNEFPQDKHDYSYELHDTEKLVGPVYNIFRVIYAAYWKI